MSTFIDPDTGKVPDRLLKERTQRFENACELRQPDRVPIVLSLGYLLADMYGVTHQELHENEALEQELLEKATAYFQPDAVASISANPAVSIAVGDRTTRFPGYGLDANGSFQFIEREYMKVEDYDDFLEDPSDWGIRKYWPRIFSELAGLNQIPPLGIVTQGVYSLSNLSMLTTATVVQSLRALANAIEAQVSDDERKARVYGRLAELGLAPYPMKGCLVLAPFDYMADSLRGMRGIMLDMHRYPEKLLKAEEKVLHFQLEFAIGWNKLKNENSAFIPLHRGSDGFMSISHFERFYWPQLKVLILGLVEAGIRPVVYYEGVWDQRLTYLSQLPAGKTIGFYQSSDISKVKKEVGDKMCIVGGMPNSMLRGGTVEQIREYTRRLCQEIGAGGGFIMSSSIGELEGSDPKLVKTWVDATKEFGGTAA